MGDHLASVAILRNHLRGEASSSGARIDNFLAKNIDAGRYTEQVANRMEAFLTDPRPEISQAFTKAVPAACEPLGKISQECGWDTADPASFDVDALFLIVIEVASKIAAKSGVDYAPGEPAPGIRE